MKILPIVAALALGIPALAADEPAAATSCPRHAEHMKERATAPEAHAHGVDARGDAAMGFSHQATTHHFLLRKDGGASFAWDISFWRRSLRSRATSARLNRGVRSKPRAIDRVRSSTPQVVCVT